MNKHLFNLIKIFVLIFVLFLGGGDVLAQVQQPIPGQLRTDSAVPKAQAQPTPTPTQEKGLVDKATGVFMEWAAPEGSVLAALFPTTKNCNYIKEKLYQPFSAIDKTFPGAETLGFIEVNNRDPKEGGKVTCISVASGTENLLKILFTLLISIIIILSVINISVSGIQYMTEEATGQIKGGAKKRLQNSLIALALGLLSYTILYTVNRQLVAFNFNPGQLDTENSVDGGIAKAAQGLKDGAYSTSFSSVEALQQSVNVGGFYGQGVPNSPNYQISGGNQNFIDVANNLGVVSAGAKRLNDEALEMLGQTTCKVSSTNGGKLACAYVVNNIINNALGKPLRGEVDQTDTYGRSTVDMKKDLDSGNRFYFVGTSVGLLMPGDIIISPTVGNNTGHVGIYTSTGKIVSNSSSRTVVDDHFTPASWVNYYSNRKNLVTYIYRYRI